MRVDLDDHSVCGPGGLLERLDSLPDPLAARPAASPGRAGGHRRRGGPDRRPFLRGDRTVRQEGPPGDPQTAGDLAAAYSGWCVAPGETTIRMLPQRLDADQLDRAVGAWLAEQADDQGPLAVDGKILKGARADGGRQVHLFAALTHDSGTI